MFFIAFFATIFSVETGAQLDENAPDYVLSAKNGESYETINGWNINVDHNSFFNLSDVNEFQKTAGISELDLTLNTRGTTLVLRNHQMNGYFKHWNQLHTNNDTNLQNSIAVMQNHKIPREYTPINAVEFKVVDKNEYKKLMNNYNSRDINTPENIPYGLMFLPYPPENNEINKEEIVKIGRMDLEEDILVYKSSDFKIHDIIKEPYKNNFNKHN